MLNSTSMRLKQVANCVDTIEMWNCGNGQGIREDLLRQACKSCEFYATDILIFFDGTIPRMFTDEVLEADIYFRQSGVDWELSDGYICSGVPKNYRHVMKLVRNIEEKTITIYESYGNV